MKIHRLYKRHIIGALCLAFVTSETSSHAQSVSAEDSLQEVINIPFGKIKKAEVVNDITTLNASDFENDNIRTIEDALIARIPGLTGTLNNQGMGDMLVFIDGMKRPLNTVTLHEVEQITVLKDVNASVLYGTQASNGVILITTKRGQAMQQKINVSVEQGVEIPIARPNYLNSADYMTLYNEARRNDGLAELYTPEQIENYRSGNPYQFPDVDYYSKDFMRDYTWGTRVNADFSGGDERTRYYTSMGWDRTGSDYTQGKAKDDNFNKFNVRGNVDFRITDYIKSHLDVAAVFEMNKTFNGDFWSYAANYHPNYYSPLLPIDMLADPSLLGAAEVIDGKYILGGTSQYQNNLYGAMNLGGSNMNAQRTAQFNGGIDVDMNKWVKGLSASANVSFDFYNSYSEQVKNTYAVYQPTWNEEGLISGLTTIGQNATNGKKIINNAAFSRTLNTNLILNYNRSFGLHQVAATLLGYYNQFSVQNTRIADKTAHLGLRATYNYARKYYIDFSSAMSNSIKLGADNKLGYSPSLGLGWVISKEDFWNEDSFIDYLKLRATGGILQTDISSAFGYNLYNEAFNVGGTYKWNDNAGYDGSVTNIAQASNPFLGFEKKTNLNIGFDAYLLSKTLNVSANYFYTAYGDQVVRRSNYYGSSLGSFVPYDNYGEDIYRGAELGITWNKQINQKLRIQTGLVMTYATSKVKTRDEAYNNAYQYRAGNPTDAAFGLEALGFYQDQAQIDAAPISRFGTVRPGDIVYKDQNGDGQIDANDEVKIGNTAPRTSLGLNINLQYGDFSLFVLGQAAMGYDAFTNNATYDWVDGDDKYSDVVWNRWTPETAVTATYPRLSSQANSNNFRQSTFWKYDASYFSLRRVQLGYSLPQSLLADTFIKKTQFFVRGANLLMLGKNAQRRQTTIGGELQNRTVALGVNLSF